jgi:hypothetical protein
LGLLCSHYARPHTEFLTVPERRRRVFGWIKAQAGYDQVKVRGRGKAEAVFTFAAAAYNLLRIPALLAGATT